MGALYNELASAILKGAMAVIGIAVAAVVLPWLKTVVIPWMKEKHCYDLVLKFVQAAEKIGENCQITGEDKKAYVVRLLERKGLAVTPDIDAFIESAVKETDAAMHAYVDDIIDVFYDDINEDSENKDDGEQE